MEHPVCLKSCRNGWPVMAVTIGMWGCEDVSVENYTLRSFAVPSGAKRQSSVGKRLFVSSVCWGLECHSSCHGASWRERGFHFGAGADTGKTNKSLENWERQFSIRSSLFVSKIIRKRSWKDVFLWRRSWSMLAIHGVGLLLAKLLPSVAAHCFAWPTGAEAHSARFSLCFVFVLLHDAFASAFFLARSSMPGYLDFADEPSVKHTDSQRLIEDSCVT